MHCTNSMLLVAKKHASKHGYGYCNVYTKLFHCFEGNVGNITITRKRPQKANVSFSFLYNVVSVNHSVHFFSHFELKKKKIYTLIVLFFGIFVRIFTCT